MGKKKKKKEIGLDQRLFAFMECQKPLPHATMPVAVAPRHARLCPMTLCPYRYRPIHAEVSGIR